MTEYSISLSAEISQCRPEFIQDIVLVRRNAKGEEVFSFSLIEIDKTASVDWKEIISQVDTGQAGQGIYQISGDIHLFQNDSATMNQLQRHLGHVFGIHVLYLNGMSISSEYVRSGKRIPLTGLYQYIADRFNNIEPYRSSFGVTLVVDDKTSSPRQIHIIISGATAEKINVDSSASNFYSKFTNLNPSSGLPVKNTNTGG